MKNSWFFILSFLLFCLLVKAQVVQEWDVLYNGPGNNTDEAYSIAADNSGNVYVTGKSTGTTNADFLTIKYNSAGVQQWAKRYNGPGDNVDVALAVTVDSSGNVYVTGYSTGTGTAYDYATIKYDTAGNELWIQRYNRGTASNDQPCGIVVDNSGNVYVSGTCPPAGNQNGDYVTIKYNSSGVQQWAKIYSSSGGISGDYATSMTIDQSQNVYVTGRSMPGANPDYLTIKYNSAGDSIWTRRYNSGGGADWMSPTCIKSDNSGNVCITGWGFGKIATVKYDSSGSQLWGSNYEPASHGNSLVFGNSGNIYVVGVSGGSTAVIKYNINGVQQWAKTYNGYGHEIKADSLDNIYITGDDSSDVLTKKYDLNGNEIWSVTYDGPDNSVDVGRSLVVNETGEVFITGSSENNGFYDYITIKYNQFCNVSGTVTYRDNGLPVSSGFVKAVKYNSLNTDIITMDSCMIQSNGHYELTRFPVRDSVDLMFYQNDDELDFVPTYYVSTIDWREATSVYATQNLTNINGQVFRINNTASPYTISGMATRNTDFISIAGLKDAVIYAKIGNDFKNYGISVSNGTYIVTKLPAGSYTLYAHRMGFLPLTQNVTITNSSLTNINFDFGNPLIGINPSSNFIPGKFNLSQNYPNPFNPTTTIKFAVPKGGLVKLLIYDITGREISQLVNEYISAGEYSVNWDASGYSSGIYFYRLITADFNETKKMILIK